WPMARLLEQPCLEWKLHAQKGEGSSCSGLQQRQRLGRLSRAKAWKDQDLAARKIAGRQGSNRQDRLLGLGRTSRWQGASNMPRPARRREGRPPTPQQGRRP